MQDHPLEGTSRSAGHTVIRREHEHTPRSLDTYTLLYHLDADEDLEQMVYEAHTP